MELDAKYSSSVSRRPGPREHIKCDVGDIGEYVLLPGDPGRVAAIAERLDDAREVAYSREFRTFTGRLGTVPVSVTSTGIGGPSTAIALEELAQLGARTVLRIGTCGAMQPDVHLGDLVLATGAVRDEGTSHQYAPSAFPAVSHPDVVAALRRAGADTGVRCHAGVVHTTDTFYGQHEPQRMPIGPDLLERYTAWRRLGVLCSEMESATVLVVSAALGLRAGAVLAVAGNRLAEENLDSDAARGRRDRAVQDAITVAVDAIRTLATTPA